MLVEYSTSRGFPSEVDLFITQAVLQYLCLSNLSTATVAFKIYTANHPAIKAEPPNDPKPPFLMPLLNFVWFLLLTVETRKLALFTVLCEQYRNSIGRDPAYRKYLDRIGQLFFGVPPPSRQSAAGGGLFGNLMASMMGGAAGGSGAGPRSIVNGTSAGDSDDDDDDDEDMSFEEMLSSFMRPPTTSAPNRSANNVKKTLKGDEDLD